MMFTRESMDDVTHFVPNVFINVRKHKHLTFFICISVLFITLGILKNYKGTLSISSPMEEPDFLRQLRDRVLFQPDRLPYNLSSDGSSGENYSSDHVEPILTQLFKNKKNGIFLEAGAYDGQIGSNTLYLERFFGWSGLLVEPVPGNVQKIKHLHRKAWLAPVCLSVTNSVMKSKIYDAGQISHLKEAELLENKTVFKCATDKDWYHMYVPKHVSLEMKRSGFMAEHMCDDEIPSYELECYPMYSLVKAIGYTEIDFFSLDVEGSELQVLKTIPFEKVNFHVIMVETDKIDDFSQLMNFFTKNGYHRKITVGHYNLTTRLPRDMIFVKNES